MLREGFIQQEKFSSKKGVALYDTFYASLYDNLLFDKVKNRFKQ